MPVEMIPRKQQGEKNHHVISSVARNLLHAIAEKQIPRRLCRTRSGRQSPVAAEMKYLTYALIGLIVAIQYPLWMGKGSWLRVWEFSTKVDQQKEKNIQLAARNAGLDAEVRDLKQGIDAMEERARVELGMIKPGEVFYQVIDKSNAKQ